tara:strand:+ start:1928 stop:2227 length:300 start_codon:yes stop_codon:yes gene_type:complete
MSGKIQLITDLLYSVQNEEQAKPFKWLFDELEQSPNGLVFIGSKKHAEEIGVPEEWSDTSGGFFMRKLNNEYSYSGPGILEEALEYYVIPKLYPDSKEQ